MTEFDYDRRKVLAASGAALTIGLAGCSGDGDSDGGNGNGNGGNGGTSREDFMSNANNYDGSLEDMTGEDSVTITVAPDGQQQYAPAGVEISTGTTVTWEWAASGHSVTAETGADFDSGVINSSGETFEQTFDSAGEILYFCIPHKANGHKGVLNVV